MLFRSAGTPDADGVIKGTYTMPDGLQINGLKETFTLAITARNELDEDFSTDSCLISVYKDDFLRVIVDGDEATDDPYKLSNAEWLKGQVTPGSSVSDRNGKSINEYRQGVGLSIKAHVNYNQYTFGMSTDKISWDSFSRGNEGEAFSSAYQYFVKKTGIFVQTTVNAANFLEYVESGLYTRSGDKASVNFKRGGFYSDIYTYNYDGYDPNTDMMIVGNNNGQATIRAKHISSGQEKYVDVEIETMKDKLFMFSVLPKGEIGRAHA